MATMQAGDSPSTGYRRLMGVAKAWWAGHRKRYAGLPGPYLLFRQRGCSTKVSPSSLSTFSRLYAMGMYFPVAHPSSRFW